MSVTILLILVLASKTISAYNLECKNITYCECSENQLGDINSILISNNNLAFTIGVASWSDLQVDCNNLGWYEFNIIRKEFADVVDLVKLENCHLPREFSLKNIVQMFGIKETNGLSFQSYYDLSRELKREHLEGFSNLTKLVLSNNGLTNVSSDLLSNFSELEFLDLSENNLVLSKDNFNETLNLKQLDLHNNKLTELPLYVFHNLQDLITLNLERNSLKTLDVRIFDKLISLKYLNLSSNLLSSLQEAIFKNLEKLETIDLSNNAFWYLPSKLFTLNKNLKKILVQDNKDNLTSLHDGFLTDLKNLEEVHMRNSKLKSLQDKLFTGTTSVKFIDWSENLCEDISETAFVDVFNTKYLTISHNRIRMLPDLVFQYFKNLEVLDLSYNRLYAVQSHLYKNLGSKVVHEILFFKYKKFFSTLLKGLTSLKELNMEGNHMRYIDKMAFYTNKQLSIAKFSNNLLEFNYLNKTTSPFFNNHLLKELHLPNNLINHLFSDWTTNKLELELLDLRHNEISTISAKDFFFSSDEVLVNLSYNNISRIVLSNNQELALYNTEKRNVIVHVENNPILCDCHLYDLVRYSNGDMPITVYNFFELKLGNLTCVNPKGTQGPQINQLDFKTYQCLEEDYFQSEKMCLALCTCYVRPYDTTRILDCSYNKLSLFRVDKNNIKLKGSFPLMLNLTGNYLMQIPSLDDLKTITITGLLLSNNEISEISLDRLPKTLKVLELHNNHLLNLNYEVSEYLFNQNYKKLTLSGNPFECDCDNRYLYRLVLKMQEIYKDLKNVKCKDQNNLLVDMTVDQLCSSNVSPI